MSIVQPIIKELSDPFIENPDLKCYEIVTIVDFMNREVDGMSVFPITIIDDKGVHINDGDTLYYINSSEMTVKEFSTVRGAGHSIFRVLRVEPNNLTRIKFDKRYQPDPEIVRDLEKKYRLISTLI